MKRILMLNYEFPPLGGGAANANYHLLKEFSKDKNIEIDLITSSINKFKKDKFSNNIKIHYLNIGKNKNMHYQTNKELLLYAFKAWLYAKKLINKQIKNKTKYDICHAWFGIPSGFIAMLLKIEYKLKYIVSLRGSDVPFYNKRFVWLDTFFFKYLSKMIWKNSESVISNSEGLKKLALKTRKQKIDIIYNGVDTNYFKPNLKKKEVKERKIKLISTGRLIKRKGYDTLLKALNPIKEKFELTLIGNGDQKKQLIKYSKKYKINCKFLGEQNKNVILKELQKSDIFILPSLNEGMSNSILEAMACGLPIITTNTGGSEELIKGNGWIVKKKNINQINLILRSLKKRKLNHKSKKSLKIISKMSWNKVAIKYKKTY